MTGPMSMALFHHAGLAMASYAHDCHGQLTESIRVAMTHMAS
jgi:hypothetical protein